ncbi:hypothetical protein FHS57_005559 [Runella defluvii]|uniref:Beta/gamma crystallin 'Greek key' domain-containing protein n=1 Tax=Runella defluvii TaxID=370973 RepID=A0A7W6ETM2_9BACT|nr:T9SS type A sorting domain-containing protein [Runella defluvii]MBB3841531.1 hypothetical protein [Runella defluvii]
MKNFIYALFLAACCYAIDLKAQSDGAKKLTKSFTFSGSVHAIVNGVYELNGVNKLGQPRYTHTSGDYEVNYDGKGTWWLNTDKNLSGGPKYYRAPGNEQGPPSTGWVDNEGHSTQVNFAASPQNVAYEAALLAEKNARKAVVTYAPREGSDDVDPNQVIKVAHVPATQVLNRDMPAAAKQLKAARAANTTFYIYNLRIGWYRINDDGGGCNFSGENPDPRYKVSTSNGLSFSQTVNVGDDKPCGWQRMVSDGRYMQSGNFSTTSAASPFKFDMNINAWEEDGCGGDNDYNDDCFTNDDDHPASTSTTVTIDPSKMNLGYNYLDIEWSGSGARYGLSLEWELLATPKIVTLYSDANLSGRTQHIGEGDFNFASLATGVGNDNVSSMEIAPGYKALLYNNSDFAGYPIDFRGTVNFVEGPNDRASSIRIVPDDNLPGNNKTLLIYYNGSGKSLEFQLQRFATKVNADQMVFIKGVGGDNKDYTSYNQDNLRYQEGEDVNQYDGYDAFNPFPTTFYSRAKVFKNDNYGGGMYRYFFGVDMDYDGSVSAGYEDEDSYTAAANVMRVLRRYNLKGYNRIVISGHSRGSAVGISSFLYGIKKALESDPKFSEFNGVLNTVLGSAATINVVALDPVAGADTPGLRNNYHMGDTWRAREIYQWLKGRFSNINFSELYANGGRMLEADELLGVGSLLPGQTFDPSPNYLHVEPSNGVQRYWLGYRHSSMVNKEEKWSELYDAAGIPRPWLHTADMLNAAFYDQSLFRNHTHWYTIFRNSDQLAWLKALELYGCTDSPSAQAGINPLAVPDADLEFKHYHGTRHKTFDNSDQSPVNMDDFVGNNNIKFHCSDESQLPTAEETHTSSNSHTDSDGWTHYCSCNGKRLLSLKLGGTGASVPDNAVSLKESSSNYFVNKGQGFITNPNGAVIMSRSWNVNPTSQPNGNVGVRYYFRQRDYDNINTHLTILKNLPALTGLNRLFFYHATSGAAHARVADIPTASIVKNGSPASTSSWVLGNTLRGDYYAEYQATSLLGGSGGGEKCATPAMVTITENSGTANDGTICEGTSAILTATGGTAYSWSTGQNSAAINVAAGGTYTVTVSNDQGCSAEASATITVTPASVGGTITGAQSVCTGTNSTTLTLSNQVGTIQKWQSSLTSDFASPTDITNTTTSLTATNLTQTTYYRAVVQSGMCNAAFSATGTITVNPVTVGGSVSGSATVCTGTNSTTLTLANKVGDVQKWQSSLTSDFANPTDISNTTTSLTASNLTQTTYYRAVVKSGVCEAAFSSTATVTVDPANVGGSLAGSATVCSGTNSTALTLSNQVGTIQKWQSSLTSDFATPVDITNTTTSLTATNLTQTTYYRVVVKSGVCDAANSATATVTVNPVSVGGSIAGAAVCSGTNSTTLSLTDKVGDVQKWQSSLTSDFATPVDIANTTTSLTVTNLTQTTYYRAVVKSGVCDAVNSATATVAVSPVTVGGSLAGSATVCSGTNSTTLTLSGKVGDVQKWQSSLTSDFANPTDIANTTTSLTASNLTQTTYYRAIVKSGVCEAVNSATATVTVSPVTVGGSIGGSATVCSGTNSTTLTLLDKVGDVQKWQSSLTADFATPTDIVNTTTSFVATNLTQTMYYRAVVKSGVCDAVNSATATVTVNPVTVGGSIGGSATVCTGTNSTTLTLSGKVGDVQKWQSSLTSDFANPTDIANTMTSLTASNLTQTTHYRAIVKSGVCEAAFSSTATVTVDPVNVGGSIAGSTTVCAVTNSTALTLSGKVGDVQKWQSSLTSDFANPVDIANTTTSFTATNLTQMTYYRAMVKSGVCEAVFSSVATVTVDPVSVGGSIAGSTAVCTGTNSTVLTLSGQVGTIQKWQSSSNADFNGVIDIANTTNQLIATNLTQTTYYRAVTKSGVCSQANSTTAAVLIHVKPTVTLSTLQQTLNEGNNRELCDTDANPVNSLQFSVTGACVAGLPVWRSQVGNGAWSDWSANAPVSQLSNNQPHRYQAACDVSCLMTYTSPIEVKINYRASTPQNVSLVADGTTVNVGETKEVCNIEGNALMFKATCAEGEMLLYSVDGGDYSSILPVQQVDGQYHNYRVRCRKSDGTASCVESESGVMRLRITNLSQVPVASLNVTNGCGTAVAFSGTTNCGNLTTVWYNATTDAVLSTLPSQTPSETTSYYARCQAAGGCLSEKSNVVTFTIVPVNVAPVVNVSSELVCTGTEVTVSTTCPVGTTALWNTGVTESSFKVSFINITKQGYSVRCVSPNGCQSAVSSVKEVSWKSFELTLINIGESKSAVKANERSAWANQFITRDGGPELEQSTQQNPTLYYVENANKMAPRYWTINVETCGLGSNGSMTFDMLATPETGLIRSFNTHENNAPYFMYANREGWTELYGQNHPAYGFYQDNGAGANVYDAGLPKGLYKLGIRYWDMKGWGSIYPSTRKPQGNVLAYQEYWFRIQSKDGIGVGAARAADNGEQSAVSKEQGDFAIVMPNPVTSILRLKVQESKGQVVQTTLTDASGRAILRRQFVPETNTHQEEFGVSELPTGMYFLQVVTPDKQATLKVVKVH